MLFAWCYIKQTNKYWSTKVGKNNPQLVYSTPDTGEFCWCWQHYRVWTECYGVNGNNSRGLQSEMSSCLYTVLGRIACLLICLPPTCKSYIIVLFANIRGAAELCMCVSYQLRSGGIFSNAAKQLYRSSVAAPVHWNCVLTTTIYENNVL
jgi:hypothetical protein